MWCGLADCLAWRPRFLLRPKTRVLGTPQKVAFWKGNGTRLFQGNLGYRGWWNISIWIDVILRTYNAALLIVRVAFGWNLFALKSPKKPENKEATTETSRFFFRLQPKKPGITRGSKSERNDLNPGILLPQKNIAELDVQTHSLRSFFEASKCEVSESVFWEPYDNRCWMTLVF